MKIVQINTVPNGSTGTIMMNIHNELLKRGHESYVVWGRGRKSNNENEIYLNDKIGVYFHALYSRITGKVGFASVSSTKKLVKWLDKIEPDIIHLHNIHGYYINIEILFKYFKEKNIKVVWTLHDCWSFTGHCSHFDAIGCNKWKIQCYSCPQKNVYPKSFIDNSRKCYQLKKNIFTNVKNLTIVTPSIWLADVVKQSFLGNYSIIVVNNGIDINTFKRLSVNKLNFKRKYNLENKKIILGVASPFTKKKGFYDFLELSKYISDEYIIVLVGLSKKQIKQLPDNVLGLMRTNDIYELVDIYNSSDYFFNLTYEDTYPTVNLESVACGLPVVTYNTGGSRESAFLDVDSPGMIKKCNEIKNSVLKLLEVIENSFLKSKEIDPRLYSKEYMIERYIDIYEKS